MDRDKRWERVQVAYNAIVEGKGAEVVADHAALIQALEAKYARDETDEFFKPVVVQHADSPSASLAAKAVGAHVCASSVLDEDTLIFVNFRADRMREINLNFGMGECPFEKPIDEEGKFITLL